ncbi:hypothetical protein, partial [Parasphingorhabdus sp.]|uniref:hypothetical protein n=1 Tax=Parasphingorhabdus sp. TaxID=2709688 RepID=UPI0032984CA2
VNERSAESNQKPWLHRYAALRIIEQGRAKTRYGLREFNHSTDSTALMWNSCEEFFRCAF